jgi:hypothetical protein
LAADFKMGFGWDFLKDGIELNKMERQCPIFVLYLHHRQIYKTDFLIEIFVPLVILQNVWKLVLVLVRIDLQNDPIGEIKNTNTTFQTF